MLQLLPGVRLRSADPRSFYGPPYLLARCRLPTQRAGYGSRYFLEPPPYLLARCRLPTQRAGYGSRNFLEPPPYLLARCRLPTQRAGYGSRYFLEPPIYCTSNSIRRFCARPPRVSLLATGRLEPRPRASIRSDATPRPRR